MTDEQIMQALECCSGVMGCVSCAYHVEGLESRDRFCHDILCSDVLELINRQKAEIERLTKLLDKKCDRCIAKDRAEAIKEFAEKIKRYIADCVSSGYAVEISDEEIDEIAKGMMEEQEDD